MGNRGRPKKPRKIDLTPKIRHFSPRGKPGRPEEVYLGLDELEALKLADEVGLSQKQAAKSMCISQQTFSRILKQARKTVADAIVNGKIIEI